MVAGCFDWNDQAVSGFSLVVKFNAATVVKIIGKLLFLLGWHSNAFRPRMVDVRLRFLACCVSQIFGQLPQKSLQRSGFPVLAWRGMAMRSVADISAWYDRSYRLYSLWAPESSTDPIAFSVSGCQSLHFGKERFYSLSFVAYILQSIHLRTE